MLSRSQSSAAPLGTMSSSSADTVAPMSQLVCRVCPCESPTPLISVSETESRIEVGEPGKGQGEALRFDRVLHCHNAVNEQEQLFEVVRASVLACLHGTSLMVVAHGSRQSGKSYALTGFLPQVQLHGIVPRAIQDLAEAVEAGSSHVVALEASFYELRQDGARDLMACNCPQIGLRELAEPPYVVLDSSLSVQRWERGSPTGFGRLSEAYYAGLEQRRKGGHACFQIACIRGDGRPRTHLRFVEMAWPRIPSSSSAAQVAAGGDAQRSAAGLNPQEVVASMQGGAAAAIDQVVQGHLSGNLIASAAAYRHSPLALMLKPCFEGTSALCFIHCLRPEASQVASLAASAPLLAKIHLWLSQVRAVQAGSQPAKPGLRRAPSVPRLPLGGALGAGSSVPSQPAAVEAMTASPSSASPCADTAAMKGTSSWQQPEEMSSGYSQQHAYSKAVAAHPLLNCYYFLETKRASAKALTREAALAGDVLQDLSAQLRELHLYRSADADDGPTERETSLKIIYERVFRSLRRTAEELQRTHEDIEVLQQFIGDDLLPAEEACMRAECYPQDGFTQVSCASTAAAAAASAPDAAFCGQKVKEAQVVVPTLPLALLQQQQQQLQHDHDQKHLPSLLHLDAASESPSTNRSNSPPVSVLTPSRSHNNSINNSSFGNYSLAAPPAAPPAPAPAAAPAAPAVASGGIGAPAEAGNALSSSMKAWALPARQQAACPAVACTAAVLRQPQSQQQTQSHGSPLSQYAAPQGVTHAAPAPAPSVVTNLSGSGSVSLGQAGGPPTRSVPTPARPARPALVAAPPQPSTSSSAAASVVVEPGGGWPGQNSPPAGDRASWPPRQHSPPATLQRSATIARITPVAVVAASAAGSEQSMHAASTEGAGTPLLGSSLRKSSSMAVLPSFTGQTVSIAQQPQLLVRASMTPSGAQVAAPLQHKAAVPDDHRHPSSFGRLTAHSSHMPGQRQTLSKATTASSNIAVARHGTAGLRR